MKKTLILYEGRYGHSEKTAGILHEMLEGSQCLPASEAPEDVADVAHLILVFGFLAYDTAKLLKPYVKAHQADWKDKTITIVGAGLAREALPAFVKIIEGPLGRKADHSWFVMGGYRLADLTPEDRVLLEEFWGKKKVPLTDRLCFREEEVRSVGQRLKTV